MAKVDLIKKPTGPRQASDMEPSNQIWASSAPHQPTQRKYIKRWYGWKLQLLVFFPISLTFLAVIVSYNNNWWAGEQANIPGIESTILFGISEQDGIPTYVPYDVDCPDSIDWEVGRTFHCIVDAPDGRAMVDVTMENDDGDITWRVAG